MNKVEGMIMLMIIVPKTWWRRGWNALRARC